MALVRNTKKRTIFVQLREHRKKPIYTTSFTLQTDEPIEQVKNKFMAYAERDIE